MTKGANSKIKFYNPLNPVTETFTKAQAAEFRRCAGDFEYFARAYVKIQTVDRGVELFNLRPYQKDMTRLSIANRFTIFDAPRQSGKSSVIAALLLWFTIFNTEMCVGIASNKLSSAKVIIKRVKFAYEELPEWMKPQAKEYNVQSVEFSNNSSIEASATTIDGLRSKTFNIIFLDEFAHIKHKVSEEFWTSTFPVISSGQNTKVIIASTPNGTEGTYAALWFGALQGDNGFVPYRVDPDHIEGRGPKFKAEMLKKMTLVKFRQEFNGEFLSSKGTLVSSMLLESLKKKEAVMSFGETSFFLDPKNRRLLIGADVGTGIGADFSTLEIFDLETLEQVGEFRSNVMNETQFTKEYIKLLDYLDREAMAKQIYYSVENNSYGLGVLNLLETSKHAVFSRRYVNLVTSHGQKLAGINCNAKTKKLACTKFKDLVENNQLKIYSQKLISELRFFVKTGEGFKAESGAHDDLVSACLTVTNMLHEISYEDETVYDKINKGAVVESDHEESDEGYLPIVL